MSTYVPPTRISLPVLPLRSRLRRQAETAEAFTTHLGPIVTRRLLRRPVSNAEVGRALRAAFDQLGSTYVKFGQLVASSPGAFGVDVAAQFRSLLDEGARVPFAAVQSAVESAFDQPLEQVFASFDTQPIAAASMAVVHRARLNDGTDVAVKVLRPGMAERVAVDLDIMQPMLKQLGLLGLEVAGALYRYLAGFRSQVAEELDLRNEAVTMTHMRRLAADAGLDRIVVPQPIEGLVAQNVLVMEFLDGVPIDDFSAVTELGMDPKPLVRELLDFWFLTGLQDGVFHGDIHAGNLMLLRDGRLGLLDWGIVGVLDEQARHVFRRWVQAMLGDVDAFADVAEFMKEMVPFAVADADEMLADANREMGELLNRPFGEIDLNEALRNRRATGRPDQTTEQREAEQRRIKAQRRFDRKALRSGLADSDFGQANFLLFKQLLYFDRYGKLYLSDEPLLGNREKLLELLERPVPAAVKRDSA